MKDLLHRGRWLIAGVALAVAGTYGISRLSGAGPSQSGPLDVAPAQAQILLHVDVRAVMSSHLYRALLDEDEGTARRIERTCGYDPLDEIERAVVFSFGPAERPFEHLGFVARGEMARGSSNRERLVGCVRQVVHADGGAVNQVEVEGVPAISSAHGSSFAAFLGDDGVVGGDREVVATTLRVADGRAPSARSNATLAELWRRVAPGRDLVLAAELPSRWLPMLSRVAQLDEDESGGLMRALAAVRAAGVGLSVRRGLALGASVRTDSAAGADELQRALRARIDAELADPMARFSVIGAALRRVHIEAQERDVVVTATLSNDQIDEVLGLWRELRQRRRAEEPTPAPTNPGEPDAPDTAGSEEPQTSGDESAPDETAPDEQTGEPAGAAPVEEAEQPTAAPEDAPPPPP